MTATRTPGRAAARQRLPGRTSRWSTGWSSPDGSVRWFQGRGSPVRDGDGQITSWIGVGIDITESKQVEQELRDYEYETRLAFSAGPHGFVALERAHEPRATGRPSSRISSASSGAATTGRGTPSSRRSSSRTARSLRDAIIDASDTRRRVRGRLPHPAPRRRHPLDRDPGPGARRRRLDRRQHRRHRSARRRGGAAGVERPARGDRRPGSTRCSPTRRSGSRSTTGIFATSG